MPSALPTDLIGETVGEHIERCWSVGRDGVIGERDVRADVAVTDRRAVALDLHHRAICQLPEGKPRAGKGDGVGGVVDPTDPELQPVVRGALFVALSE